jgi:hypothetical protein
MKPPLRILFGICYIVATLSCAACQQHRDVRADPRVVRTAPITAVSPEEWKWKFHTRVVELLTEVVQRHPATSPTTLPATRRAVGTPVMHVVLVWLKKPGDPAGREAIVRSARSLRSIPGVVSVRAGSAIPSDREVADSSYDVGLLVTFEDEAAMRAYGSHPVHQKMVEEVIKPHVERYRVYDFRYER